MKQILLLILPASRVVSTDQSREAFEQRSLSFNEWLIPFCLRLILDDESFEEDSEISGDDNDNISDDDDDWTSEDEISTMDVDEDFSTNDEIINNWEIDVVEDYAAVKSIEQRTINVSIDKCRSLVNLINNSSILSRYIKRQKKNLKIKKSLLIDCKQRRNSTHRLIRSILAHKSIICRMFDEKYSIKLKRKQRLK